MDLATILAQSQPPPGFLQDRTGAQGCVQENGFCPGWIADHIGDYMDPLGEHVFLVVVSMVAGFAIAFSLSILAHKRRWLTAPITIFSGILYTIPSVAAFFLLLPLTGRGKLTGIIVLTAYTLLILFRNITTGLRNVPDEAIDAARGMGMSDSQILRGVELPLALPEILAGVRIAFTTTVGLATLAFFGGAGGLGAKIYADKFFQSNVVVAGGLAVALAAIGDLIILTFQRFALPWRRAAAS